MGKQSKSQWDFGELFPPEQTRRILSVSELTVRVKRLLEQQVGPVWVTGEATNLRAQNSGHVYFTLKDATAQLNCVLFRGEPVAHRQLLQDGQKLLLQGDLTVYEARGQYQLIVHAVELQGTGSLQIAFEKLKQKLQAEGLFAPERKRPLPRFPQRIGVVTSPTGAALRDVLHVVQRRNPSLEIILAPCRVQGEGAAREIAAAIRLLNEFAAASASGPRPAPPPDLILVTRGGGSLEDLWAFNEEAVARAIFESALPVVSAVGHEIDFTISDFVADLRAATPSAAAEIITEGVFSSCQFVSEAGLRLRELRAQRMAAKAEELRRAVQRLARLHPRRRINDRLQRLDDLRGTLARCSRHRLRQLRDRSENLSERLARVRPAQVLKQRRELFFRALQRLKEQARHRWRGRRDRCELITARLYLLGPEQVLARGYSLTLDETTGRVVRAAAEVKNGQRLRTRLKSGEILSKVEK